jgi:hypothetical protein
MDPSTGKFHEVHEIGQRQLVELPNNWPVFRTGEEVILKDYPFRIQRINQSSIVLRPVLGDASAYIQIKRITR